MTKGQRYKQEMLVRVRDFGAAYRELFPESSPGGEKFAQVAAAVTAIDQHLKGRVLGKAGARGVNATTRAAVSAYLTTIAKAARRITRGRRNNAPFRLPKRRTLVAEVATARAFLDEAAAREAQFVAMGLPVTFVSDLKALVDELSLAVDTRLNSKTMRGQAQAGIASAVRQGLDAARDLDVVVEIATRQDDVAAATWRTARRIEGLNPSPSTRAKQSTLAPVVETMEQPAVGPPASAESAIAPGAVPPPAAGSPPVVAPATSPASEVVPAAVADTPVVTPAPTTVTPITPVLTAGDVLARAS